MTPLGQMTIPQVTEMERGDLIEVWTRKLGYALPKSAATSFLRRAVAFEVLARQHGDLTKTEQRAFMRAADQASKVGAVGQVNATTAESEVGQTPKHMPTRNVRPGSVLLREWNGRTYEVRCTNDGFVFDGQTYKSLSKIARRITGAHWSGPRFFGLVKTPSGKKKGELR